MSSSPGARKVPPPRPKIQLPLPGQYYPQTGMAYVPTPFGQTPIPMTPVSGQPQVIYSNRASEFVFSQFKGIKDWTKSGLSVGEKSAFWLYEKVSSWSKRWFTHIFLFVVVLLYSIGGAMIFVTIEGTHEDLMHFNIRKERNETLTIIRELWNDETLASNSELWNGRARNELMKFEEHLYEFYKRGLSDRGQKVWTFWNAVFYCGTIYTTIGATPCRKREEKEGPIAGTNGAVERAAVAAGPSPRRRASLLVSCARFGLASSLDIRCGKTRWFPFRSVEEARGGGGSNLRFISVPVSVCTGARKVAISESRERGVLHRVPLVRHPPSLTLFFFHDPDPPPVMEDSYAVHRRRKAAARRREKTPDPSSRNQLVETSDDEEGSRRARMEKMADEAEQMEQQEKENKLKPEVEAEEKKSNKKMNVEEKASPSKEARENDAKDEAARSAKKEAATKLDEETSKKDEKYQDAIPRSKEVDADNEPSLEPRKERRLKKKSRERIERQGQSTDSSELDEKMEKSRRTKSPEGGKHRAKKSAKRITGEPDVAKKDTVERPPREKKEKSKRKAEETEEPRERRQTDDTDEDPKMKKSESFPKPDEPVIRRSASDIKKQIIPLSDDTLIEDFAKAQREYMKREHSILDPDNYEIFEDAQEETSLRRRKFSIPSKSEEEEETVPAEKPKVSEKKSWLSWLPFFRKKKEDKEAEEQKVEEKPSKKISSEMKFVAKQFGEPEKVTLVDFLRALKDVVSEFKAFVAQNPKEVRVVKGLRNRCMAELLLVMIYCGLGAFVFRFTEGAFESFYKCGVKRVKRDFLDSLWNYSHNMREDDWKSMARRKLMEFEEQLHTAHEAGLHSYSGQRSWSFLNAVVYCLTVITTIGYGHISPSTNTGRAITIVYAIFGIPMFLIILADFGKLFTRGIKFLWAFVRRLYYTGSCRKVRGTVPVQEVMKGVQLVYDLATFKRPSQINPEDIEEIQKQAQQSQTVLNLDGNVPDTPGTPAMSAFAIDDEFNLPISVAIFILLGYIFVGATLFCLSEGWGFFESFYFVFISMSTIGFGDYVPKHPIYMMCSIIYLVFGLALTSMCINVVQVMLSDSFRQASQKIGATIGFAVAEEDGSVNPAVPPPIEIADIHASVKESNSDEKIAPKAKQEDVDL